MGRRPYVGEQQGQTLALSFPGLRSLATSPSRREPCSQPFRSPPLAHVQVQALLVKLIAADEHVSAIQALLIRSVLVCALAVMFALPRCEWILGSYRFVPFAMSGLLVLLLLT